MTAADFVARLAGVRPNGQGWTARCPAHEDARASLSVGTGANNCVILNCFAGCPTESIVSAMGLTLADLFDDEPKRPANDGAAGSRTVATYPYHALGTGERLRKLRGADKTFTWERANGGAWVPGLDDGKFKPGLYRADILTGDLTWVSEGEKDCDRARALGLPAVCGPHGSNTFSRAHTQQLVDAGITDAIVVPDLDTPGLAYADRVAAALTAAGIAVRVVRLPGGVTSKHGADLSDYLDAGHGLADLEALAAAAPVWTPGADDTAGDRPRRTITLTPASEIRVRPVRWTWDRRLASGTLALLGGREGIGKSIVGYTLGADLTRGRLPGVYAGRPRSVIVAATEDSWEHVIVPRLMAADADLSRVFRVDVRTAEGTEASLSLPRDLPDLQQRIPEVDAALVILDPLLSRLDAALDSHKDAEVRLALEPLARLADVTDTTWLGLIHVNKGATGDPLSMLMGSRAFAAVARSVLFLMADPDDEHRRLLGTPKNNLGRADLPTLALRIVGVKVAETPEGPVWTGKVDWLGETKQSIKDAIMAAAEHAGDRGAAQEAADWLHDYLVSQGGTAESATIKAAGASAGHTRDALHRGRQRLPIVTDSRGFPRRTYWVLQLSDRGGSQSSEQSSESPGETSMTATTQTTAANRGVAGSSQLSEALQSSESSETPRARPTTGGPMLAFEVEP